MNQQGSIADVVREYLASDNLQLPVFNRTVLELQRMLGRDDFSAENCAALITRDPALASQVLREANSSFYSGLKEITTIKDAFIRLGAKEVLSLTLLVTQKGQYTCRHQGLKGLMAKLWQHSYGVALAAYWLARRLGYPGMGQEAFMAGLLHDIGELFLLKILDEMASTNRLKLLNEALVKEILESMHVEQGSWLMQKWGLPEIYRDVVKHHHSGTGEDSTLLLLVRLADQACYRLGIGHRHDPDILLVATREARLLDVRETTLAELEIMLEDKFFPPSSASA